MLATPCTCSPRRPARRRSLVRTLTLWPGPPAPAGSTSPGRTAPAAPARGCSVGPPCTSGAPAGGARAPAGSTSYRAEGRQKGCPGVPQHHWTLSNTGYPCFFNTTRWGGGGEVVGRSLQAAPGQEGVWLVCCGRGTVWGRTQARPLQVTCIWQSIFR